MVQGKSGWLTRIGLRLGIAIPAVLAGFVICLTPPRCAMGQAVPILGGKVYRAVRNPQELVKLAKSLGMNTMFVGDELAASVEFRQRCRDAGLKYFLIIRTFNDPAAAAQDPSLVSIDRECRPARRADDVMVCPSRQDFRRAKMEQIAAAIKRLKPDGVTLDYFRFFIYWEGVDPQLGPVNFPAFCFDWSCLDDFQRSTRLPLNVASARSSPAARQALITEIWERHREQWYQWRVQRIEANARELTGFIRKAFPGLPIVLHAVPWTRDEFDGARQRIVGQDLHRLAPFFDYVSPMEYSALTRRGPGWVAKLNQELLKEVPATKLLPSIEVGPDGPEFPPLSARDFEDDLRAARRAPAGVVLYHLELLLTDPEKQAITQRHFNPDPEVETF